MKASDFNRRRELKSAKAGASRAHRRTCSGESVSRIPYPPTASRNNGDLLVSRPSSEQLIVVVKAPATERQVAKAFLYAAKPLTENDFDWDVSGKRVIIVRSTRFVLERQLDPNWYKVSSE